MKLTILLTTLFILAVIGATFHLLQRLLRRLLSYYRLQPLLMIYPPHYQQETWKNEYSLSQKTKGRLLL